MAESYKVPESVKNNAKRGLELRQKYGRGGLDTRQAGKLGIGSGVARARDLIRGSVSLETVKKMWAFFNRHEKNKDTPPAEGNGMISWLLWGGDSGFNWIRGIINQLEQQKAKKDAPNYRFVSRLNTNNCQTCRFSQGMKCEKYSFNFSPGFTCDSWRPDENKLKAYRQAMSKKEVTTKPGSAHGPSIKNPRVYEALRRRGMDKTRAARISNAMVTSKKEAPTKLVGGEQRPAGAFLVVGDKEAPSTWHLPVLTAELKPDRARMGAALAALTVGYRGQQYQGPDKAKALAKLRALYKKLGLDMPTHKGMNWGADAGQKISANLQRGVDGRFESTEAGREAKANYLKGLEAAGINDTDARMLDLLNKGQTITDPDILSKLQAGGYIQAFEDGSAKVTDKGKKMLTALRSGDADKIAKAAGDSGGGKGGGKRGGGGGGKPKAEKPEKPTKQTPEEKRQAQREAAKPLLAKAGISGDLADAYFEYVDGGRPDDTKLRALEKKGLITPTSKFMWNMVGPMADLESTLSPKGRALAKLIRAGDSRDIQDFLTTNKAVKLKKKSNPAGEGKKGPSGYSSAQLRAIFAKLGQPGGGKIYPKNEEGKRVKPAGGGADADSTPKKQWEKGKPSNPQAVTVAFGQDPRQKYKFETVVVDADTLITSNTVGGGINEQYDPTLQPRIRSRVASQQQIDNMARNLVAESLTTDFHQLDKGMPIIGDDMMVESGNGRTLALLKAKEAYPEKFAEYQAALKRELANNGLTEDDLRGIKNPVLVRRRLDDVDRASFAREANSAAVLQMSPLEKAKVDANLISESSLNNFSMKENQNIDQALRSPSNKKFVDTFLKELPENERAALTRANGTLNQQGIWRIKAAMFAKTFQGEAGDRISDTFLESLDSTTKNFEKSFTDVLPRLAVAESMIASGQRPKVSIMDNVSKSLDMLARLRESGTSVKDYLNQGGLFGKELTPAQESLLAHFDGIGNSTVKIRSFLNGYIDTVLGMPHPSQGGLFGGGSDMTPEQLLMRLIAMTEKARKQQKAKRIKTIPPLKKKGIIPPADSLAMALNWDKVAVDGNGEWANMRPQRIRRKEVGNLVVFKERKTGRYRWIMRTTNAFTDRDGEIISTKALADMVERNKEKREYGPLRWWHVKGADLGTCDFQMIVGHTLIESGTFNTPEIAKAVMKQAQNLEVSPGFRHPANEPDKEGVYHNIEIFERSILPKGKAANGLTGLFVVGETE